MSPVADRFHVVKLINHHVLKTRSELDEVGRKNRGLLSPTHRHRKNLSPEQDIKLGKYLPKHPELGAMYDFKQFPMKVILSIVYSKDQASHLIPDLLEGIKCSKKVDLNILKYLVKLWNLGKKKSLEFGDLLRRIQ